jgi:hypothetical protein
VGAGREREVNLLEHLCASLPQRLGVRLHLAAFSAISVGQDLKTFGAKIQKRRPRHLSGASNDGRALAKTNGFEKE